MNIYASFLLLYRCYCYPRYHYPFWLGAMQQLPKCHIHTYVGLVRVQMYIWHEQSYIYMSVFVCKCVYTLFKHGVGPRIIRLLIIKPCFNNWYNVCTCIYKQILFTSYRISNWCICKCIYKKSFLITKVPKWMNGFYVFIGILHFSLICDYSMYTREERRFYSVLR